MHLETGEATGHDHTPLDTDGPAEALPTEEETAAEDITTTAATATDSTPSVSFEDKVEDNPHLQDQEEKHIKFGKIIDPHVLGCCEYCGGPVKRKRFCSPLKRFCSKGCSRSSRRANLKVYEVLRIKKF